MKKRKTIWLSVVTGIVTILILVGVARVVSLNARYREAYLEFCSLTHKSTEKYPGWHVAIYLDVEACLSCCENMKAWQELEEGLLQCGGALSLWAPVEDSIDVAIAMELEGLRTPVQVLSDEVVKALGWEGAGTPIKVLLDSQCQPIEVVGPASGRIDSRRIVDQILSTVCSEGQARQD